MAYNIKCVYNETLETAVTVAMYLLSRVPFNFGDHHLNAAMVVVTQKKNVNLIT